MEYSLSKDGFERFRNSFSTRELEQAQAAIAASQKMHPIIDEELKKDPRGRKPTSYQNPLYKLVPYMLREGNGMGHSVDRQWFEDLIYGACYVVGKTSGSGKFNVSPRNVRYALLLAEVSTANCKSEETAESTARLLAQVTRYTIDGMARYLHSNPRVYFDLAKQEKEAEAIVCYDPPSKPYGHSLDLYKAGDYLAYGLARQQETSGKTLSPA